MAAKLVAVSGSPRPSSRTTALIRHIAEAVADRTGADLQLIELATEGRALLAALTADELDGRAAEIVAAVETADLLVVGSPVYRASYSGLLKHLFDLVDRRALAGTPVALAASGGTALHGLMTEHQLRPLFSFFQAVSLPTAVYALETDFTGTTISNPALLDRLDRLAAEATDALTRRVGAPVFA